MNNNINDEAFADAIFDLFMKQWAGPRRSTRLGGLMQAADQAPVRLLLLRHAHVDGHQGDVPITEQGHKQARRAGEWLIQQGFDVGAVLYGGTRRTCETAEGIVAGLGEPGGSIRPTDSFALRNPDLYLGGERVSMVSSAGRSPTRRAG